MDDNTHFRGARLSVDKLAVSRGLQTLAADISFTLESGDMLEIRGKNGAGKSSLMRVLAGLLRPGAGKVFAAPGEELAALIHYLGHDNGLKSPISVAAHLDFWARLLGGEPARAKRVAERLGLASIADLPARFLSQGQQRRLGLARLLMAARPIWLLDEPAAGLDAAGKRVLTAMVAEHRANGGIVVAALHEPFDAPGSRLLQLAPA